MILKIAYVNSFKPEVRYMTTGASGIDLVSAIDYDLLPENRILVPTGISVIIPKGYEGQVRPRSGLANRHGVTVLNSPGTIDSDYRGEIKVLLINLGDQNFEFCKGDRIAQFVFSKVERCDIHIVEKCEFTNNDTERSSGGFGSTGK